MNMINTKKVLTTSLSVMALSMVQMAHAAPAEAPDAFVKRVADALVSKLKTQRAAYKKDPKVLSTIVQQNIEPYVDFEGFSRGVMGKYSRNATEAQKKAFTQTFKNALMRTYTNSLAAYDNESYTIRPYKAGTAPDRANVVMDFKTDDGKNIPVLYQLVDMQGQWKIRNVQLNGIDLGLTFQNQFNAVVQQQKGNIDLAIKNFVPK